MCSTTPRAYADAERMGAMGLPVLAHQTQALKEAGTTLASVGPELAADAHTVFSRTPGLAAPMEQPDGLARGFGAILHEGEMRRSPELRAARFVETWRGLEAQKARLSGWENADARKAVEGRTKGMAEGIGRDPQVEFILRNKRQEFGLGQEGSRAIGEELTRSLDRGRGMKR